MRSSQQAQDLRLHRDVQRRDRLVRDENLGIERERACDADALALAAGELVRIAVHGAWIEADQLQQLAARCQAPQGSMPWAIGPR